MLHNLVFSDKVVVGTQAVYLVLPYVIQNPVCIRQCAWSSVYQREREREGARCQMAPLPLIDLWPLTLGFTENSHSCISRYI